MLKTDFTVRKGKSSLCPERRNRSDCHLVPMLRKMYEMITKPELRRGATESYFFQCIAPWRMEIIGEIELGSREGKVERGEMVGNGTKPSIHRLIEADVEATDDAVAVAAVGEKRRHK